MRLDKFLKVSRILKRRTQANAAAEAQRVSVNGNIAKPSKQLKIGDEVCLELSNYKLTFVVKSLNEKATKDQAAELYEIKSN